MSTMRWDDVAALIDGCGPGHLSTSSVAGEPHVSIVFAARDGATLWFAARTRSGKVANLRRNPLAALMWQGNGAETYLWGTARLIDDAATKQRVWTSGLFPYDMAGFFTSADSPDWLLVEVTPNKAVAMVQTDHGLERRTWSVGSTHS